MIINEPNAPTRALPSALDTAHALVLLSESEEAQDLPQNTWLHTRYPARVAFHLLAIYSAIDSEPHPR